MANFGVDFFQYKTVTLDGCQQTQRFSIDKQKIIPGIPSSWVPVIPTLPVDKAVLVIGYASGKTYEVDVDGQEHHHLVQPRSKKNPLLHKLMNKIIQGQPPGLVLGKVLNKIYSKWPRAAHEHIAIHSSIPASQPISKKKASRP